MKDVKGYEGLYAVTSCGRVWSYRTKKFLKPDISNHGYFRVNLFRNDKGIKYSIHRLVAEAYILNEENLPEINHKDEDKSHNYINNLEWCDHSYNSNYGTRNKRVGKSKMQYKCIRCIENSKIYKDYDEISNDLNIDRKNIRHNMSRVIKTGHSLSGYHFEEVV